MYRYALYTRKSSEQREETEKSTREQVTECERIAKSAGIEVAWQAEESKSAKIPNKRPLYSEMIALIEKGKIDAILCWKINRLVRNMEEGGKLSQLLIDGKIQEIRTPFGVFRAGEDIYALVLECAQSAQYSISLTQDVKRGMAGHFENGGWNHRALVGYLNARHPVNHKVGVVIPDPERFDIVRKGWEMMLTGAYTPAQVAQILNETYGFRSRMTTKRGGDPLSRSYAYLLFRNPFYTGFVCQRGKTLKGTHKPMVSADEFQQVQKILDRQARKEATVQAAGKARKFAYTGLMRCGYCGCQITAEFHTLSNGNPYIFYRCTDAKGGCTQKGMSEKRLETRVLQEMERIAIDPQLCDLSREVIIAALNQEDDQQDVLHQKQIARQSEIERQLSELTSMWLRRMVTDEAQFNQLKETLESERRQLILEMEGDGENLTRMRATVTAAFHYLKFARSCFLNAPSEQKREIAHALATEYRFFGEDRKMEIVLHPLLKEVVHLTETQLTLALPFEKYPKSSANRSKFNSSTLRLPARLPTIEPPFYGYSKPKETPRVGAVSIGGRETTEIDLVPEKDYSNLMRVLREIDFPFLDFLGEDDVYS